MKIEVCEKCPHCITEYDWINHKIDILCRKRLKMIKDIASCVVAKKKGDDKSE